MTDREKVIKGLENCITGFDCPPECPYLDDCNDLMKPMFVELAKDAIALLKEQEKTRLDIAHEMVSNSILMYQGKEIVRCKDCKHYVEGGPCRYMDVYPYPEPEWFCASAERRET